MIVLFKTFSAVDALLISHTLSATRHGFGRVRIDSDTFGARLRPAVFDVLNCERHFEASKYNLRHRIECNIPLHQIHGPHELPNSTPVPRSRLASGTSGNQEILS